MLLRPGKEGRRNEPDAIAAALAAAGVPIAAELAEPAFAEGGDTVWLDEETLLVGIGYRTNPAAVAALGDAFPGVDVIAFDLPHWNGRGEVMHLMSFISPLDRDLALVYPRIAPVRLLELLAEREIEVVEVPDEEFETQGPNVLALGLGTRSPSTGTRRRAAEWSAPASTSSSTAARRSRGRATAARPASRARCFAPRRARSPRRTRTPSRARPRGRRARTPPA